MVKSPPGIITNGIINYIMVNGMLMVYLLMVKSPPSRYHWSPLVAIHQVIVKQVMSLQPLRAQKSDT